MSIPLCIVSNLAESSSDFTVYNLEPVDAFPQRISIKEHLLYYMHIQEEQTQKILLKKDKKKNCYLEQMEKKPVHMPRT